MAFEEVDFHVHEYKVLLIRKARVARWSELGGRFIHPGQVRTQLPPFLVHLSSFRDECRTNHIYLDM